MVSTQLLTYLRNHLYPPHLNLLLYFGPDNHNGELIRKKSFSNPSSNLTKYLFFPTTSCTTTVIYFLGLLKKPSLISYSRSTTLAFTTVPTIILFPLTHLFIWGGRAGGDSSRIWDKGVHD